ncbi:MAG: hypothetical protein ACC658_01250 [Acidimicrobiia bacterium]
MDDIRSSIAGTVVRAASLQNVATMDALLRNPAEALEDSEGYSRNVGTLCDSGSGKRSLYRAQLAEQAEVAMGLCVCFPEFLKWRGQPDHVIDRRCILLGAGVVTMTRRRRHER